MLVNKLPLYGIDVIKANPGGAYERMKADQERIKELEDVCRNALTSLAIINMPVQGNPANVATDKELMDIMAESFKQALKGGK